MYKFTKEDKILLSKFLYPTDECRKFVLNDLNQELNNLIDKRIVVSSENIKSEHRKKNRLKFFFIIGQFFKNNPTYLKIIKSVYNFSLKDIIYLIAINFVFYTYQINTSTKDSNFFKDTKSILYTDLDLTKIFY